MTPDSYTAGWDAALQGLSLCDNPYDENFEAADYNRWFLGWLDSDDQGSAYDV